ncbi:hypothetical protein ACAW74_13095 [Fibrella sp. WM1]|uniref:hypothetical protein n=1 Tax=Fibrella musci TaxID=3242485 RepID=UPI00352294E3
MWPFRALLITVCCRLPLVAQSVPSADERTSTKLYRATIRTTTGTKTQGILYAVTDSTVLIFHNDPSTIQLFREGNAVPIDTLRATAIKRIAIQRKGHFGRTVAIGAGVTAALATTALLSTANSEKRLTGVVVALLVVPIGLTTSLLLALPPLTIKRINGRPERLAGERAKLERYSIRAQIQQASLRTATSH